MELSQENLDRLDGALEEIKYFESVLDGKCSDYIQEYIRNEMFIKCIERKIKGLKIKKLQIEFGI